MRKLDALLGLFQVESLGAISRDLGITASRLAEWPDAVIIFGEPSPKSRPAACLGVHAARCGRRFEAHDPLRQAVRATTGGYTEAAFQAPGLLLRHGHGSQFMSDLYQQELRFLGIVSSPAFVRQPEGNGCTERFVRTLKGRLLWTRTFATIEELSGALQDFGYRYNHEWLIQRRCYHLPAQQRALPSADSEAAA